MRIKPTSSSSGVMRVRNSEQRNRVMEKLFFHHSRRIAKHTIPQGFHEKIFLKLDDRFTSIFQSKT
jgi:hypothetical protein